jgi:putative membrane protein
MADDASLDRPEPATPAPGTRRYPYVLLALFAVALAASAIKPWDFKNWLMENALTGAFVVVLVLSRRRLPLSNVSYTLIFLYMCLHVVGSHYSYSRVPIGIAVSEMLGWQRNHYDRLVHFAFGLLLAYPIREMFLRVVGVRGFWGYYLPLDVTMSFSMLYELIEWGAAAAFGGELGMAYLGTQGDEWDAHRDMALATVGAVISMSVVAFINWRFDRDFADEFRRSLEVKGRRPLGEFRLRELMAEDAARDKAPAAHDPHK